MNRRELLLGGAALLGLAACTSKGRYYVIYPYYHPDQKVYPFEGYKIVTPKEGAFAAAILSNPVAAPGFADIAFATTIPAVPEAWVMDEPLHIQSGSALRKTIDGGEVWQLPEDLEDVYGKLKSFGCSPDGRESTPIAKLPPVAKTLTPLLHNPDREGYLRTQPVFSPGTAAAGIIRLRLPALREEWKSLFLTLPHGDIRYTIRFRLAPLR